MRSVVFLWCLIALAGSGAAQDAGKAYLIPQTIFVGDPGRLALPLETALPGAGNTVLDNPERLPTDPGLVISRVELENRGEHCRLVVDFTAFRPGVIDLPPIEIASFTFTDLTVTVASILEAEGNAMVLSGPAPPLAVPGAMGMIYGTVLGLGGCIAGLVLLALKGGPAFGRWKERFKRRYMFRSMARVLRYLRNTLDNGGSGSAGEVLDKLSAEFKTFLGLFTGMNCRAMTGEEFLFFPSLTTEPSGPFLRDFFRRCDTLRFSGVEIERRDVTEMLDQAGDFAGRMEKYKEAAEAGERALSINPGKRTGKAV
jgi:hypothetical protein